MTSQQGFLLTRQWRDTSQGIELELWLATAQGPMQVLISQQEAVFFVREKDLQEVQQRLAVIKKFRTAPVSLNTFKHEPVTAVYFSSQQQLYKARDILQQHNIEALEADIRPADRFLMERFITAGVEVTGDIRGNNGVNGVLRCCNPKLIAKQYVHHWNVVSIDIETHFQKPELYSIAVLTPTEHHVFMVGDNDLESSGDEVLAYLRFFENEKVLLQAFLVWFQQCDPDIVIGWNVINFDLRFLQNKCDALGVRFNLGRQKKTIEWRQSAADSDRHFITIPGRVVLDGIETLKSATYSFESFSLDAVANNLLNRGKLIHDVDQRGAEIEKLFNDDKVALAKYNLENCQLVIDIFEKTQLIEFAQQRAHLTGLTMGRSGGSVAAFDYSYLPRLHRNGYVAPNLGSNDLDFDSPGGYVLDSHPGLYQNVLVLDFKSLYPSIIRTFLIDPLGLIEGLKNKAQGGSDSVPGFDGGCFSREKMLLPDIIKNLWHARDVAKENKQSSMSQAIKIIMNSFYGVLGSSGCRFYDPRLASSITKRGHEIIQRSCDYIEQEGYKVIYGDTDSVFVWLADEIGDGEAVEQRVNRIGNELAAGLNEYWDDHLKQQYQLDSCLEIEFETHYIHFLMPTIRGSEKGSKKRYAGVVRKHEAGSSLPISEQYHTVFKGLEAVRTDWTQLAKNFQQQLYQRVFFGQPYEQFVKDTLADLLTGQSDQQLIYRKRLRRKLDLYLRNVPPHVQAARKADQQRLQQGLRQRYQKGGWIEYVITLNGPEPLAYQTATIDYQHYIDRQLAPVADSILYFLDNSFEKITQQQLGLFSF